MSDEEPRRPISRPSIPPLAWVTVGLWVGVSIAERACWGVFSAGRSDAWLWLAGVACGLAAAGGVAYRRSVLGALVLISACAGLVLGGLYWTHWAADVRWARDSGVRRRTVEVIGDEVQGSFGSSSLARLAQPGGGSVVVTVQWPQASQVPQTGQRVEVLGGVVPVANDEWGRRAHQQGSVGRLRARQARVIGWAPSLRGTLGPLRAWAVERIAGVPGPGGDLIAGVVLGDRRRLAGTPAETDFRTTGLTHLVAVSGSHLVVVAAVAGMVLSSLRVGRVWRSVAVASLVGAYVVFSGVQPSAVRAWVMAVAASAAWVSERRADGASTLAIAAAGVLLASPNSAFDLGFRLSVCAVAGLVLFARLSETWLQAALPRWLCWLAAPMSLTLAATASTLPLTVPTFKMVSLVSPLANLVAGPIVSVSLVLGLAGLAASAIASGVGGFVLRAAGALGAIATAAAGWMASWRYAAVPATVSPWAAASVCAVAGVGVWAVWPTPSRRAARGFLGGLALLMALCAAGPVAPVGPRIVVLDVGQGDAVLVRDGARTCLIDTGPSPGVLRDALARSGIRRLDRVIITHLHADHSGGLPALEGLVTVGEIQLPAGASAKGSQTIEVARRLVGDAGVREVAAGSAFAIGSLSAAVVSPAGPVQDAAENESSVVVRIGRQGFAAVLTGDAESDVLEPLASQGVLGDVDVLKIGHHGSSGAVSPTALAVLRPEWALISVGAGNKFGHPTASTLAELQAAGPRVVRTDRVGDITVEVLDTGCRVTGSRSADRESRRAPGLRGAAVRPYATLAMTRSAARRRATHLERHGQSTLGVQTGLPHLRGTGPPARAGPRQAQGRGWADSRPRLQHGDIRG